ncbi:hypothetical protein MMC18_004329 [Xylographa bjoerkii]|nr:hypothetical protein [Xylographa bjoerkii]
MQRAVLQPFPAYVFPDSELQRTVPRTTAVILTPSRLTTTPLPSLPEEQRLDALIQNLEAHHRNVKAALVANSLATLSARPAGPSTDPRLANRAAPQPPSDSQDALLASLKIPYKSGREKSFSNAAGGGRGEDGFFGEVGAVLERLREYECGSTAVVEGLKAERERVRERDRVEKEAKAGGYDRARDPRLRR